MELKEALTVLGQIAQDNSPDKLTKENVAKTFAAGIMGFVPVVYGFGIYSSVARRFKQQFNENSKMPAKWEAFPELDHNEIVGWEKAEDIADGFAARIIRDHEEPLEIRSRIETTKQLIHPSGIDMYEIYTQGKSALARILSLICIGDYMSVYLAILRGIDPTPVQTINNLKDTLKKNGVGEEVLKELGKKR